MVKTLWYRDRKCGGVHMLLSCSGWPIQGVHNTYVFVGMFVPLL